MPRKLRKKSKTKIYHVIVRALSRQTLFDEDRDFLYYLKLIKEVKETDKFELYAYCLMTNHLHMLIKENEVSISTIMNKINSRYAKYFNLKNGRTGYVFNDRFHSENVETVKYFLTCTRYIHQNPVKALICKRTYEYKFSSIHAYRREKGNYLNLVNTAYIKNNFNVTEFLKWNECRNHDKCLEAVNNKLTDNEVTGWLYKATGVKNKKEFLQKDKEEKINGIMKLIEISFPLAQLSRVTGMSVYQLSKLKENNVGTVATLTYKK